MPFHLIACSGGDQSESIFLTRLLLPAGYSTDDLAQDLRVNFPLLADAKRLCTSERPVRGLPSAGLSITPAEQSLLPTLPAEISTYDELVEAAEAIDAVSIHVFSEGSWHRVRTELNQTDISTARLFKIKRGP